MSDEHVEDIVEEPIEEQVVEPAGAEETPSQNTLGGGLNSPMAFNSPMLGAGLLGAGNDTPSTVRVTYIGSNGFFEDGRSYFDKILTVGEPYGEMPIPARYGYYFIGFYTAESGGDLVTSDTIVENPTAHSLYAYWSGVHELAYDNKFVLCDWYFHPRGGVLLPASATAGGEMSVDLTAGTISVNALYSTTAVWTNYSQLASDALSYFTIPVEPLATYSFTATAAYEIDTENIGTERRRGVINAFFFGSDGSYYGYKSFTAYDTSSLTLSMQFVVPEGASQMQVRFGCYKRVLATFSDIAIRKVDPYAEVNYGGAVRYAHSFGYDAIGTLAQPTRSGYEFGGWFTGENGTGDEVKAGDPAQPVSMTVYSKWLKSGFTVTFDGVTGAGATKSVTYGSAYGTLPEPTASSVSKTFAGWFTDGGELVTAETIVSVRADHTLHPRWVEHDNTLVVTPKEGANTARFRGAIAAGEHVPVIVKGAAKWITSSLRLRVVGRRGETLAEFPAPESTTDAWAAEGGDASCMLNLNTVQALAAVPPAATISLLFVLDDYDGKVMYFKDFCEVTHWPRRTGEEEPVDLDNYKDIIAEFGERIDAAEESISGAVDEANGIVAYVTAARNDAQTAAQTAGTARNEAQTAQGKAEDAQTAAEAAQVAAEAAQEAAEAALPLDTTLATEGKAADAKAVGDAILDVASDVSALSSGKADKATTLAGYGITDAKIANGAVVLGSSSITPLTEHQSLAAYVNGGSYDSTSKKILLKHDSSTIAEIDATAFIKDGMVSSVEIDDGNLVITFNTDAGQEPIEIPLTDIFDPADYYDKDAVDGLLDDKVDKVEGKGLSTNDYTTAEKTKLTGIAVGAEVNVIETVKVNGTALTPSSKAVDITVPTGTAASKDVPTSGNASTTQVVMGNDSRLSDARTPTAHKSSHATGGSDAIAPSDIGAAASSHTHSASDITSGLATVATSGDYDDLTNKPTIPTIPSASSTSPVMDGTAAVGSSTAYARADHVHPSDTSKADASALRYAFATTIQPTAGTAAPTGTLTDRAGNKVVCTEATGQTDANAKLTLTLPPAVPGYMRDFIVKIDRTTSGCYTVDFVPYGNESVSYETADGSMPEVPDGKVTWLSFTENESGGVFTVRAIPLVAVTGGS